MTEDQVQYKHAFYHLHKTKMQIHHRITFQIKFIATKKEIQPEKKQNHAQNQSFQHY